MPLDPSATRNKKVGISPKSNCLNENSKSKKTSQRWLTLAVTNGRGFSLQMNTANEHTQYY